jgi:hypothetical protein
MYLVGVFSIYPEIVFGKHEESNSEDKSKSDSNNQATTTTTTPTEDNKQSDVIPPIVPPTTPIPTIAASQTCSDGSDKTNDKICVESAANQEQAVSQPQSTPIPQSNPIVNTEYLENSLNTISTQADNINDTTLLIQLINSAQ